MKISIIIPLYNCEKYIAETIESALAQTWQDKEIIVVDDGSTDNSLAIAKSYENEILKVYSQPNGGVCAARNFGFTKSTGDYIQYLDNDDLLAPDKIEVQMNYILKNNLAKNDVVYGLMEFFEQNPKNLLPRISFYGKSYDNPLDFQNDMLLSLKIVCPLAYLLHRDIVAQVGGWNEALLNNEDVEFFTKIMAAAARIVYVPDSVVFYRATPNSLSKKIKAKYCEYRFTALVSMASIMLKNNFSQKTVDALSFYFHDYIINWFPYNKLTLKRLEKFMKKNNIPCYEKGFSKKHKFLLKTLGWQRTFLLKNTLKGFL